MKKLILFGGAFDPIHFGHINMALEASKTLDSDVLFIPARISVWKENSLPSEHKMKLIELTIKEYPRFQVSDYEIKSTKDVNYSIDTVRHFKKLYPDYELYYLIGTDHVDVFHKWKDADELSSLAHIIYFDRPGYLVTSNNKEKFHMTEIKGNIMDANSHSIRNFRSLELCEEAIYYIEENDLYYMKKIKSYFDNERRFNHSKSVARLAYKIAKSNKMSNPELAYMAGMLHDIGKSMNTEIGSALMKEICPEYIDLGEWSWHQFIGAYIAQKSFGIKNESIIKAIKFHATGSGSMDLLGKIIYASDKIDPIRGYDSSGFIEAMMKNAETGFIEVLNANREYLETNNKSVNNELTYKCFKRYLHI